MALIAAALLVTFGLADNTGCNPGLDEEYFTESYLEDLCPGRFDKSYRAEICDGSKDPITGVRYASDWATKPFDINDPRWNVRYMTSKARERSLKSALVNQIYGTNRRGEANCRSFCMYDPANMGETGTNTPRVGFIWRPWRGKRCWDMVDQFTCFNGRGAGDWKKAQAKVKAIKECRFGPTVTSAPVTIPPVVPEDEQDDGEDQDEEELTGEEYCESAAMLTDESACKASSCCHWNTLEEGPASNFGAGRCWSSIGGDICKYTGTPGCSWLRERYYLPTGRLPPCPYDDYRTTSVNKRLNAYLCPDVKDPITGRIAKKISSSGKCTSVENTECQSKCKVGGECCAVENRYYLPSRDDWRCCKWKVVGGVCEGTYEQDPRRTWSKNLLLALLNEMWSSCTSDCMYDIMNIGPPYTEHRVGFIWRRDQKCWDLTSAGTCFTGNGATEYASALTKASRTEPYCTIEEGQK